jgi:tetratricopeptide (TPR) repeat protein
MDGSLKVHDTKRPPVTAVLRVRPDMRLNAALVGLLLAVSNPLAASSFKGVTLKGVILLNEAGGPPIANVQVSVIDGANAVSSLSNGTFVLEVDKQPGAAVRLILQKPGMVVVNAHEREFNLPKPENAASLTFLLCQEADLPEMRRHYYHVDSVDSSAQSYGRKLQGSHAKNRATQAEKEQPQVDPDIAKKATRGEKLVREKAEEVSNFPVHGMSSVYRSYDAMALNRDGTVYRRQNQPEKARKAYDKALEISRNLAQQDPATYLPDVADTLNNLGDMLSDQNRMEEALTAYDEALKISRNLAQQNSTYLPNVAMTLNNLGTIFRKQNRPDEERQAFDEALRLYRDLQQRNPDIYRPHVAETLNNLGILNLDQHRREETLKAFKEGLTIFETLARENPGQYGLEVESTRGWLEVAFHETLKSYRERAQLRPAIYLPYVAETLKALGILNYDQNRPEEAGRVLGEAIAIYGTLAKKNSKPYGREAVLIYETLATESHGQYREDVESTGRLLEATFDEALKSYHEQAPLDPATYQPNEAEALKNLGILYHGQNRMEEARNAFSGALAIYETLARKDPRRYELDVDSTRKLLDDAAGRRTP